MSNIFNALKRGQYELPGTEGLLLLTSLPEIGSRKNHANNREDGPPALEGAAVSLGEASSKPERGLDGATARQSHGSDTVAIRRISAAETRRLSVQVASHMPLLPFDTRNQGVAEQYRLLRTRLVQHRSKPKMLLFSSAGPGDGKSITAINTAGALALKHNATVVLIDADLRRSTVHLNLNLPAGPGLYEVLEGRASIAEALIAVEQFRNLSILTAGECRNNPTELLGSPRWHSLCAELRSAFDFIVLDSPPVGAVADYYVLEAACDAVVLVARPDHTNRKQCFEAFASVPKNKLIGVVMNCVDEWFLGRKPEHERYAYAGQ